MALRKKGEHYYGDSQHDLTLEIKRFAECNNYPADEISEVKCANCKQQLFMLFSDTDESGALCKCKNCSEKIFIRDSQDFINLEELDNHECVCGNTDFTVNVGLSFYQGVKDVRWVYTGGYCAKCGMVGIYIDWNER